MNSLEQLPLWVEVLVALLLVISSVFALIGALGILRLSLIHI